MKIRLSIVVLSTFLIWQSCQKEELPFFATQEDLKLLYFKPDSFLCTATKEVPGLGQVNWTANSYGQIHQGRLLLYFFTFQDSVFLEQRENLFFNISQAKTGRYTLSMGSDIATSFASYERWLADGDVLNATWEVNSETDNTLEITQIDTTSKIVSGKFNINLKMTTQGSRGFVHSERINFHNGAFRTKY